MEIKNYGYIAPVQKPEDYVFGASTLPQDILQTNGSWIDYLPEAESQLKTTETWNCTAFGTLACFEILFRRLFKEKIEFSDRFTGIRAGTQPPGNDPLTVGKAVYKGATIPEALLPFTLDIQSSAEYYSYKGGDEKVCVAKGQEYEETYNMNYEIVGTNTKSIIEALKTSPLGVSVRAWYKNDKGLYVKEVGEQDTHWTALVDYKEGEYWVVYDSYLQDGSPIKKLAWDYPFGFILRYSLSLKPEAKKKVTLWQSLLKDFQRVLELIGLRQVSLVEPIPAIKAPEENKKATPSVVASPKYSWATKTETRHSCRVIMDEEGLNWGDKELLCRVINAESGFNIKAINVNRDKNGNPLSTDYGICQINDYYHIGPGKNFKSVEEVLGEPEKSVRFMIKMFKAGKLNLWIAYKSGAYLNFTS